MNHTPLEPIGAEVHDLELGPLDASQVQELRGLLADRGVLIFPGQEIDDEQFTAFLRSFGELAFTTGETAVEGFPDLNVVSNVGRTTPPKSSFHVDTSYVARPPAYTALRAVMIPGQGGETLFSNQYRAYETLPDELRSTLGGRSITHVVTGLELAEDDETSAEHPVFRDHPLSGRTALYLSTPRRCAAISGMDEATTRETVEQLLAHSTRAENVLRHPWSPGDVVMWDNGCVLHRADHARVVGDRVMHRGMVADYGSRRPGGDAGACDIRVGS
jgi:taurine dioxygenase